EGRAASAPASRTGERGAWCESPASSAELVAPPLDGRLPASGIGRFSSPPDVARIGALLEPPAPTVVSSLPDPPSAGSPRASATTACASGGAASRLASTEASATGRQTAPPSTGVAVQSAVPLQARAVQGSLVHVTGVPPHLPETHLSSNVHGFPSSQLAL